MHRRASLGLIGAALLLPGCAARSGNAVRVGSLSTGENTTVAEIYAIALERAGIQVERHMRLGTEDDAYSALLREQIDLYPGHTGSVNLPSGITHLAPAPAAQAPCLTASQYSAEKYWLLTLTTCAAIANRLILAATADFLAAGGPLHRLRKAYGGFDFKHVIACEPDTQYYALNRGDADVASAFSTDAAIVETQLVVLKDEKHVLPSTRLAPMTRVATLRAHPALAAALDRVSPLITDYALRDLNRRRSLLAMSPKEAAEDFAGSKLR